MNGGALKVGAYQTKGWLKRVRIEDVLLPPLLAPSAETLVVCNFHALISSISLTDSCHSLVTAREI